MNPNSAEVAKISGLPSLANNPARYGYENIMIPVSLVPSTPILIAPDAIVTYSTSLQAGNKITSVRMRSPARPHDDVPPGNPAYAPSQVLPAVEVL